MSIAVTIPTLTTERLTLRAPRTEDFEHWAVFFASERLVNERGPLPRRAAWTTLAADVANWTLRGYGPFGLEARDTGTYVGEVGIYQTDGYPEPELGWFVVPEAEGKGYATEAACAVMAWAHEVLGWRRLVNYIHPANSRSIALGQRLGGVVSPDAGREDPDDMVIVHRLGGDGQ